MRLKRLLVIFLLVAGASVLALAATAQLTNVSVVGQGNTTTVTLLASGGFRHNEYRPADDLLLVNLEGVSAGKLHDRTRDLQVPGVKSYHVIGYTGAGGVQIARVELKLIARPEVRVNESKDGLVIELVSSQSAPAETAAAPAVSSAPAPARGVSGTGIAELRRVDVVKGSDGVEIQLSTSHPVTAKTMTLVNPARLVVDLANTVPSTSPRTLKVNAGNVRSIRLGRFQENSPVTRVVIDLTAARDFDLLEAGNTLRLKPHVSGIAAEVKPAESAKPVVEAKAASSVPSNAKMAPAAMGAPEIRGGGAPTANGFVVLDSKVQERKGTSPDPEPAPVQLAATKAPALPAPQTAPASGTQPAPVAAPAGSAQPASTAPQTAVNFSAEQRLQKGKTPVTGPKYTGEPISVRLKDADLRDFFLMISEISGLNIFVDPTISGSLTLVLNDVPWDQALDIVLKSNGLDRELEGNVLRVASVDNLRKEAEGRRKQIEAQALAVEKVTNTRFLSYAHSKDVLPTIKRLLSARGEAVADDRTNAIIIDDIPNVMPAIDSLIVQLDRKTQEVEIEARVVAATRTFIRSLGSQFGFGFGNRATAIGGGAAASPLTDSGTPKTLFQNPIGSGKIPLFSDLGVTSPTSGLSFLNTGANYRIDTILTAAESRGLLKILSRPRAITQNNIQAIIKQGQRIPIVTQAQLSGPPTVQYIEAVLRLTVTPQITAENTIFLNVDIENTTPDFSNKIQGNPVFLTQQVTTSVLVTNGGTAVIGGVMQTQNSTNIDQVPFLGNVPGLGNLFKRRTVNTSTQELFFFITPRILET
jgi:type IV pilus assembly protein PilQ